MYIVHCTVMNDVHCTVVQYTNLSIVPGRCQVILLVRVEVQRADIALGGAVRAGRY